MTYDDDDDGGGGGGDDDDDDDAMNTDNAYNGHDDEE